MTKEIELYCEELRNEYKELCVTFNKPPIDVDNLYDCVTNLELIVENLIKKQNKKLYRQAKKNLLDAGIQFQLNLDKKNYILNQFKDYLYDFRIFPNVKAYEDALKTNSRSKIREIRENVKEGKYL